MREHNQNTLKDAASYALTCAIKNGCTAARISLNINTQSSYSVRNHKLDRLQQAAGSSLFIQLFIDNRYGTFSTNRIEKTELDDFIKKGCEATKLLAPDVLRSLPDSSLYYKESLESLNQYDSKYELLQPIDKKELAFKVSDEIFGKDSRIISVNTEFGDSYDFFYMLDSQGFEGTTEQTTFTVSAECSVKGRGDARPEAWWYESSMFYDELMKSGCGEKALQRALDRLNPKKMKSGKYHMVVENSVSSRLVAPIISALNGASIQQKNSFLTDTLGKRLFGTNVNFYDDAHNPKASGARYFDSEGIATKPMGIVTEGSIDTYFINSYMSKKLSMPVTIEGPSVLTCFTQKSKNSNTTYLDLLSQTNKGIFVTGFNGGNCNSSTGDFSFGVQGFWFENGKILHPIKEMNITGNIVDLWNNLIEAGDDPRWSSRWLIPSLAFSDVSFSGI